MFKLSICVLATAIMFVEGAINLDHDRIEALPHGGGKWYNELEGSVEWEPMVHDGQDVLKFTLVGNDTGYVGVAISVDTLMGVFTNAADDCYYCSRATPTSGVITITSAFLTGHLAPTIVAPVDGNYSVSTSVDDGMITCSFLRPLSVQKLVQGIFFTWDVAATEYNLLFAQGAVQNDGSLIYHGPNHQAFTNGTFNLTDSSSYRQPPTTTMMPNKSSATALQCSFAMVCIALINVLLF